jgi:hypothetical protein
VPLSGNRVKTTNQIHPTPQKAAKGRLFCFELWLDSSLNRLGRQINFGVCQDRFGKGLGCLGDVALSEPAIARLRSFANRRFKHRSQQCEQV